MISSLMHEPCLDVCWDKLCVSEHVLTVRIWKHRVHGNHTKVCVESAVIRGWQRATCYNKQLHVTRVKRHTMQPSADSAHKQHEPAQPLAVAQLAFIMSPTPWQLNFGRITIRPSIDPILNAVFSAAASSARDTFGALHHNMALVSVSRFSLFNIISIYLL